jgi:diguanylate cyclase (GGDEF)-like protein/PAS domain S-box-containing protein
MSIEDLSASCQLALEAAHMAIWDSNILNGKVDEGEVAWSDQLATLLDASDHNPPITFLDFLAFVHPDDRQRVRHTIATAVETLTAYQLEYRVIWADASVRWLAAKGRPLRDPQGHVDRTLGVVWDITALKEAEERLRLALTAARMAIWDSIIRNGQVDEGEVIWIDHGASLLGLSLDRIKMPYREFLSAVHPGDRERVRQTMQQAAGALTNYDVEYRVIWPDGSEHWLAAQARAFGDALGHPVRTAGIVWDITARKEAEAHFHLALDAARMAIWQSDILTDTVYWSPEGAALFGLSAKPFESTCEVFLHFIHPDDRARVQHSFEQAIDKLETYFVAYRVILPDWGIRWIAAKGRVHANKEGKPARTLGTLADITAQKEAEIALQEQKELAEITLRSIGDGVITTDTEGKVQSLNRIAEQLTGWPGELAIGHPIDRILNLVDEVTRQPLENVALKCLRLGQTIAVPPTSLLISFDGREIPVEDSAAPIWSKDGHIVGVVVVFQDVSHERQLKQELSWHAAHDPLTGLMNRREFEKIGAMTLARAKQERDTHALLYLDLDQFKIVNDTCGHIAGDELLRQLTALLQSQMRHADVLARLGGDELGVLLFNCPIEQAHYLADELREAIKKFRFMWGQRTFELGVSIGLIEINSDSKPFSELMSAADMACYLAKEQGRNRVHLYKETDVVLAKRYGEMLWVSRLGEALKQERFILHSQPIVHLNGAHSKHAEILIRMVDETGEMILPGAFIPAAERYALMPAIDRWVIETFFRHLNDLNGSNGAADSIQYAINLSGVSLSEDNLLDFITERLQFYGILPNSICFEITETAAISNLAKGKRLMSELKKIGCSFSLDDFGSGLASFEYLKNLPVDFIKIDGAFIKNIATNPIDRTMVAAINDVGHAMGIRTIAEFVEDDAILKAVRSIGIDFAQGYAVGSLQPLSM